MNAVEIRTIFRTPGFFILLAVIAPNLSATDPPRRAARFGYAGGPVSLTPAGLQDSTPAELNRPIATGDRFWSGADGRGELQTDNAALRFGPRTSLTVQELSNQATQVQLTAGALTIRLHTLAPGEAFEVDTPQVSVNLKRMGAYRIDADEKGSTAVTVRFGEAEVFKADGAVTPIPQGRQVRIAANGSPQFGPAPPIDTFDSWCIERDRREDLARTAHYVSRDIPGYADLDEHGAWRTVDRDGAVWFPTNMPPDWAPYRAGHFIWNDTFGMNWVDGASWGFGPLHYGRWIKLNEEWGWVPGSAGKQAAGTGSGFGIRPYYSPALVAWARFGPGIVQPDGVTGWFPLAPGEAWLPGFRSSPEYIEGVNLSNTLIENRAVLEHPDATRMNYLNRDLALTAERDEDLQAGRPVGDARVSVPQTAYARAMLGEQPAFAVTQEARLGPRGSAAPAPPEIASRPVVAHRMPSVQPATYVPRTVAEHPAPASRVQPAVSQTPVRQAPSPPSAAPPVAAAPASPPKLPPVAKAPAPQGIPKTMPRPPAGTPAINPPNPAASSGGITGGLKGFAHSLKSTGGKVIHGSKNPADSTTSGSKPTTSPQSKPPKSTQQE